MYIVFRSKRFSKSYKKMRKGGRFFREEIEITVEIIAKGEKLPLKYRDHFLTGEFEGCRECHIRPDVLLVYKIERDLLVLILIDIGSHAELFG